MVIAATVQYKSVIGRSRFLAGTARNGIDNGSNDGKPLTEATWLLMLSFSARP